jgi:hypothetical protein
MESSELKEIEKIFTFTGQFKLRDLIEEMLGVNFCIILSILISSVIAKPIDSYTIAEYGVDNPSYDVIIDQRQNGTQNFRIKVDGLFIAIPEDYVEKETSSQNHQISQNSQLESLFTNHQTSHSPSNGFGDFSELANLFDWKKKSNVKKQTMIEDTEGRTKDIPTDVQAIDDAKHKLKNSTEKEKRKYKLLLVGVNEKYIKPLLKYFKDKSEEVDEE